MPGGKIAFVAWKLIKIFSVFKIKQCCWQCISFLILIMELWKLVLTLCYFHLVIFGLLLHSVNSVFFCWQSQGQIVPDGTTLSPSWTHLGNIQICLTYFSVYYCALCISDGLNCSSAACIKLVVSCFTLSFFSFFFSVYDCFGYQTKYIVN